MKTTTTSMVQAGNAGRVSRENAVTPYRDGRRPFTMWLPEVSISIIGQISCGPIIAGWNKHFVCREDLALDYEGKLYMANSK